MHVRHGRKRISRSESHESLNDSRVPHVFEVRTGVCGWVDANFENGTRAEMIAQQVVGDDCVLAGQLLGVDDDGGRADVELGGPGAGAGGRHLVAATGNVMRGGPRPDRSRVYQRERESAAQNE